MRNLLLLTLGMTLPSVLVAGMFSWTDQSGNLIFGDTPPQGVTAKEITPPKLTVLEGFGTRYQDNTVSTTPKKPTSTNAPKKLEVSIYKKIDVIAPKQGQAIRANDGDVSTVISFSPKLRPNHEVVFTLDGKVFQQGALKVANMVNLDRGDHVLTASIVNKGSRQLLVSSGPIKFSVLRAVANKNAYNPYESE